jgi:hypothetical protein
MAAAGTTTAKEPFGGKSSPRTLPLEVIFSYIVRGPCDSDHKLSTSGNRGHQIRLSPKGYCQTKDVKLIFVSVYRGVFLAFVNWRFVRVRVQPGARLRPPVNAEPTLDPGYRHECGWWLVVYRYGIGFCHMSSP